MEERDVLKQICICFAGILVALLVLGMLPEWEMAGWRMNRIKVFSDLLPAEPSPAEDVSVPDSTAGSGVGADSVVVARQEPDSLVAIEDFTVDGGGLARLRHSLKSGEQRRRPVRVAFLGDSYIEADIITADVRQYLQKSFGGRGVGFVPVASPAAGYRQTVEHRAAGWTGYTMVYYNKADWKKLMVSGEYFIPEEGATLSVAGRSEKGSARFGEARFFFQNAGHTRIHVNVDGRDSVFMPPANDTLLQYICLRGDLNRLDFRFTEVQGFTGFGVWLNDPVGVYVDNFAVRGSSGIVLSIMDRQLMEQLAPSVAYDLVVLEFGLNVVMPDSKEYTSYKRQMLKTIRHLQNCFLRADFLLMSVGDRSYRRDGKMETQPGVEALVNEQRDLARQAGILFWNTYEAMGGHNSMVKFVDHTPPLANKDYTHINHLGGKKIAGEMVKALKKELEVR